MKKGDVLFVIDDRPFKADLENKRAAVAKDEAQIALTDAELKRSTDLLKRKVVAQQDSDTSKAQAAQAGAQLAADQAAAETVRLNLEWTRVTAPIAGRLSRMNVTVGNQVTIATLLTTIVSVDPMYCYVSVSGRAFLRTSNSQSASRRRICIA
ncbi:MAG: efflux RND transporter periplasmic adaptor subunit [Chthoniobacteraceae bacterium]